MDSLEDIAEAKDEKIRSQLPNIDSARVDTGKRKRLDVWVINWQKIIDL